MWRETVTDVVEEEVKQGGPIPTQLNKKMIFDIQAVVGRLVSKASQLIDNETTNLAESWMHIRSKFDGGKVINRSQSGSFEHRSMGAGLQQNLGEDWVKSTWLGMAKRPINQVFSTTANLIAKKRISDSKRKATEEAKSRRRRNKYSKVDNSVAARKAYNRRDDGIEPDDITDDVSPETLEEQKANFFQAYVQVTKEEAKEIELATRDQAGSERWKGERRKRLTASKVGGIIKMRKTTKRAPKVKELLHTKFKGSEATRYGSRMEQRARDEYTTYQRENGKSGLCVTNCGLFVSLQNPWLAATPDGIVQDLSEHPNSIGLLEIKNPYSKKSMTISEACSSGSSFCLQQEKEETAFKLKRKHEYFYQIQCQLYCVNKDWCDFVVRTEKDLHVERVYQDREWWSEQLPKLKLFYYDALLPELANPRHDKGGIREPCPPPTTET